MSDIQPSATAVVKLEYRINAPQERVWRCMIEETSRWWDHEFVSLQGSTCVILEPIIGGKLYEETEDGRGLVWATVIAIDPGKSIDFLGCMTPAWTGPTMTMIQFALKTDGNATVLTMTEGLLGRVTEETTASMKEGWDFVLGQKLKVYAEHPFLASV
jgi:uncharacterized protein YndB with AHSA1/START domain